MKDWTRKHLTRLYPSGLIVSTPNGTGVGDIEGPLEVLFAGVLGAIGGFVIGLLVGVLARIVTMNAIRGCRGGMHWAAYGATAGAFALAMFELLD